jgi:hypothetical protein
MAWLDADDIRQKFNIASQKYTTQIEAASASAALLIRQSVSSEIYDQAVSGTLPTDDADLIRAQSVIESQSFLTMWFLVGNVGNKLGDAGFIKQAQDTGSPANAQTITNQYLTPKELADMRAGFFENAQIAIRPYGSIDVTDDVADAETGLAVSSLNWF